MNPQERLALLALALLVLALVAVWRPYVQAQRAIAKMRADNSEGDGDLLIVLVGVGDEASDVQFDWPHQGRWN